MYNNMIIIIINNNPYEMKNGFIMWTSDVSFKYNSTGRKT